jgi:hypothetical protein
MSWENVYAQEWIKEKDVNISALNEPFQKKFLSLLVKNTGRLQDTRGSCWYLLKRKRENQRTKSLFGKNCSSRNQK